MPSTSDESSVEPFEAGEEEQLVLGKRAADEPALALLRERRRRIEENRLQVRVVAAGERRLVEAVVAEEPVAARARACWRRCG